MNYLVVGILGIIGLSLIFSILGGLIKGSRRALLRLILVVASLVLCFMFKDKLVATVLEIKIEDKEIVEFIKSKLPENLQSMTDLILPLLTAIISVITFLVGFISLLIVSNIIYAFLKIFVKKGKKKHALFGMIFGAVQGVVIGIALAAPLAGLLTDLAPISDIDYKVGEGEDAKAIKDYIPEAIDLKGFAADDKIATILEITNKSEKYGYNGLSTVYLEVASDKVSEGTYYAKVDDGYEAIEITKDSTAEDIAKAKYKKYTISGQVEAICAAIKLADELTAMSDKLSGLENFSASSAEDIQDVFNTLDGLFGDDGSLSPEAKETVENMVSEIASSFAEDLPIDISDIDLGNVDFAAEGEMVTDLMKYADAENAEDIDVNEIVTSLSTSTLILPILDSSDVTVELDASQKLEAQEAIDALPEDTDEETIQSLKYLLGLEEKPAEESKESE